MGVFDAVNGVVTLDNAARTVTFTPDEGYVGPASFDYAAYKIGEDPSNDGASTRGSIQLNVMEGQLPEIGEVIYGDGDNNHLMGGAGDDTLIGGAGDDLLEGGSGDDTYIYNVGVDGTDTIVDTEGNNQLVINGDIDASDLQLYSGSLEMDLGNGDRIIFPDFDVNDPAGTTPIQVFVFENSGTTLTIDELIEQAGGIVPAEEDAPDFIGTDGKDRIKGTDAANRIDGLAGDDRIDAKSGDDIVDGGPGRDKIKGGKGDDILDGGLGDDKLEGKDDDDTLYGGEGNDKLKGGNGDDILEGGADHDRLDGGKGDDHLSGGEGNDHLKGGKGNDTYHFNMGDGQDTIDNKDKHGEDALAFGAGITQEDLWLTRHGRDLTISVLGTSDRVTVDDWFKGDDHRIERITAGDQVLTDKMVDQLVQSMASFGTPDASGELSLSPQEEQQISTIIAAAWQ